MKIFTNRKKGKYCQFTNNIAKKPSTSSRFSGLWESAYEECTSGAVPIHFIGAYQTFRLIRNEATSNQPMERQQIFIESSPFPMQSVRELQCTADKGFLSNFFFNRRKIYSWTFFLSHLFFLQSVFTPFHNQLGKLSGHTRPCHQLSALPFRCEAFCWEKCRALAFVVLFKTFTILTLFLQYRCHFFHRNLLQCRRDVPKQRRRPRPAPRRSTLSLTPPPRNPVPSTTATLSPKSSPIPAWRRSPGRHAKPPRPCVSNREPVWPWTGWKISRLDWGMWSRIPRATTLCCPRRRPPSRNGPRRAPPSPRPRSGWVPSPWTRPGLRFMGQLNRRHPPFGRALTWSSRRPPAENGPPRRPPSNRPFQSVRTVSSRCSSRNLSCWYCRIAMRDHRPLVLLLLWWRLISQYVWSPFFKSWVRFCHKMALFFFGMWLVTFFFLDLL